MTLPAHDNLCGESGDLMTSSKNVVSSAYRMPQDNPFDYGSTSSMQHKFEPQNLLQGKIQSFKQFYPVIDPTRPISGDIREDNHTSKRYEGVHTGFNVNCIARDIHHKPIQRLNSQCSYNPSVTTSPHPNISQFKKPPMDQPLSNSINQQVKFVNSTVEALQHQMHKEEDIPKKKRTRTSPEQLRILQKAFMTDPMPNSAARLVLARRLEMTSRAVQVWFQNRRAKEKLEARRVNTSTHEDEISCDFNEYSCSDDHPHDCISPDPASQRSDENCLRTTYEYPPQPQLIFQQRNTRGKPKILPNINPSLNAALAQQLNNGGAPFRGISPYLLPVAPSSGGFGNSGNLSINSSKVKNLTSNRRSRSMSSIIHSTPKNQNSIPDTVPKYSELPNPAIDPLHRSFGININSNSPPPTLSSQMYETGMYYGDTGMSQYLGSCFEAVSAYGNNGVTVDSTYYDTELLLEENEPLFPTGASSESPSELLFNANQSQGTFSSGTPIAGSSVRRESSPSYDPSSLPFPTNEVGIFNSVDCLLKVGMPQKYLARSQDHHKGEGNVGEGESLCATSKVVPVRGEAMNNDAKFLKNNIYSRIEKKTPEKITPEDGLIKNFDKIFYHHYPVENAQVFMNGREEAFLPLSATIDDDYASPTSILASKSLESLPESDEPSKNGMMCQDESVGVDLMIPLDTIPIPISVNDTSLGPITSNKSRSYSTPGAFFHLPSSCSANDTNDSIPLGNAVASLFNSWQGNKIESYRGINTFSKNHTDDLTRAVLPPNEVQKVMNENARLENNLTKCSNKNTRTPNHHPPLDTDDKSIFPTMQSNEHGHSQEKENLINRNHDGDTAELARVERSTMIQSEGKGQFKFLEKIV